MNKSELVNSIAEKTGISKAQSGSMVDAFLASVTEALASGDDVRLPGFGSFEVSHRAATKGRNPSTGAEIEIPARSVPKFSAGKGLKEAVNKK
ncbi:HU family DNA-binding protein [Bartonella sp. B30(2025)]